MRFSQAVREGAKLKPQGFGDYQSHDGKHSCANTAALDAVGKYGLVDVTEAFPQLSSFDAQCPECGESDDFFVIAAMHLNDRHRWTREQIADWAEKEIEPKAYKK